MPMFVFCLDPVNIMVKGMLVLVGTFDWYLLVLFFKMIQPHLAQPHLASSGRRSSARIRSFLRSFARSFVRSCVSSTLSVNPISRAAKLRGNIFFPYWATLSVTQLCRVGTFFSLSGYPIVQPYRSTFERQSTSSF